MGIWDFINSSTEAVKRNAPDPVKNACRTSYNYGSAACRTSYGYGSAVCTRIDIVRVNGLQKLNQWLPVPDDEAKSKIGIVATKIDHIVRVNGLQKLNQWLPDDDVKFKIGNVATRFAKNAALLALNGHGFVPDMNSYYTNSCSLFIPICYFGEFEMDKNWRWSWKWTSDEPCISTISIRSNTSFGDLCCKLQEKLNIDPSQYDMNLGFLCSSNSSISLPPVRVTCLEEIMWLIELNKKSETIPLCLTLVRNVITDSEHKEFDGGDRNENYNWDTSEVAREDNDVIPKTFAIHHDLIVSHKTREIVEDNQKEISFTNDDLITLSKHGHSGNLQTGSNPQSTNCSGGVAASSIASKTIKEVERETLKKKPKPLEDTDSAPGRQFTGTRKLMDRAEMQPGSHYHVD